MKIYAEFDKSKTRSSGKSLVNPAAPIKPPEVADTSKQGAPYKAFTAEERAAHYIKKKAKEALEIDRSVAAAFAARDSDKKKSFAAVVSAPPDPPPAVCINCDEIGHPPWQCRSQCHLSICQAAPKRVHKATECPYYKQMQDAGRVKKPPATDKKSSAANALMRQSSIRLSPTTMTCLIPGIISLREDSFSTSYRGIEYIAPVYTYLISV